MVVIIILFYNSAFFMHFPLNLFFFSSFCQAFPVNIQQITARFKALKATTKTKSKHRCEVAFCSVGIMAAAVAFGADLGRCAKDLRPDLLRSPSKSDKHKSPNSRRRHEVGNNRRSWFSSVSTDDSVGNGPVSSPRDQDITGLGPNKRPLSTPVLLKATFFSR